MSVEFTKVSNLKYYKILQLNIILYIRVDK